MSEVPLYLQKALLHYHPDHASQHGAEWFFKCEVRAQSKLPRLVTSSWFKSSWFKKFLVVEPKLVALDPVCMRS